MLTGIQFHCCLPVLGLVAVYFLGSMAFWHVVVLETLWSTLRSMNPTAEQSILRDLVPEAELVSAVSLYSIGFNFARIVGPSIGGLLILWIGIGGCLVFYAAYLFISALALLGIKLTSRAPAAGAVLSLIVLGALQDRWSHKTLLWFSAKATPFLLIGFSFSRNLWLSIVLLDLFGAMQIIFRTVSRLIIQVETPRELLGRVMSVFLMDQGMRSLGSMVMGVFGAALGLALTSIASMTFTAITFWLPLRVPSRSAQ